MKKIILTLSIFLLMGAGCSINIDNSKVIHQPSSNSNEQKEYCQTNKDCIDMGHICKGEDDDEVCLTDYDSAGRQLENPMCVCRNPEMDYGTSIQITKMLKITELGFQIPIDSSLMNEVIYKDVEDFTVGFSTKSLNEISKYCEEDAGGRISWISDTPSSPGMASADFFEGREADIKQFDGFFLFYQQPQATCTKDQHELETEFIKAIRNGFEDASLISGWKPQ